MEKKQKKHKKNYYKKSSIACNNKTKHKIYEHAIIAVTKLKEEKNLAGKAYKCKKCGFYHVGKPSFKRDPMLFWENIFSQMNPEEVKKYKNGEIK